MIYHKFPCTNCGKNLKAREDYFGRKVGCPYCKAAVTVPSPSSLELGLSSNPLDQLDDLFGAGAGTGGSSPLDGPSPPAGGGQPSAEEPAAPQTRTDGTNVSMLLTSAVGLGLSLVFYALLLPIRSTYFAELFYDRGWVPYVEVFLTMWAVAVLWFKYRKLVRQKASMLFDLLPSELSEEITVDKVDAFKKHIHSLPGEKGESFLINRVLRGLEHFQVRKSAPEVASILNSQSDLDAGTVASSYTMTKLLVWAIPLLGFIGTVIGISDAVSGFSGNTGDIEALKASLNGVTGGLSTAFDTTLLALVMCILIKFPVSSMQKSEEDMLGWVDEYCNENLLKRLNDGRDGGAERGSGGGRSAIQQAVDGAMREHHAELRIWTKKLEAIGETVSATMAERWEQINAQMLDQMQQQLHTVQEQVQQQQSRSQAEVETLTSMAADFQQNLQEQVQQQYARTHAEIETITSMASDFQRGLLHMQQGLTGLNDVLASLGERQIVVEVVPGAETPRRSWMFWRTVKPKKNGRT